MIFDNDDELDMVTRVLTTVHADFFRANQGYEKDSRVIMPLMKSKVLRGVVILFSGVIPLGFEPSS